MLKFHTPLFKEYLTVVDSCHHPHQVSAGGYGEVSEAWLLPATV